MIEDIKRKLLGEGIGLNDPEIHEYNEILERNRANVMRFNLAHISTGEESLRLFREIVGYDVDESCIVIPPFRCDMGFNVRLGKSVLINYNCTFLDTAEITVGDHTMIGPDCHLVTACHYMEAERRRDFKCYGRPITIGKDCWFGANVTVLPGVTIGDRVVVGAGSVVTKDVPDDSVVVGNPARRIR